MHFRCYHPNIVENTVFCVVEFLLLFASDGDGTKLLFLIGPRKNITTLGLLKLAYFQQ